MQRLSPSARRLLALLVLPMVPLFAGCGGEAASSAGPAVPPVELGIPLAPLEEHAALPTTFQRPPSPLPPMTHSGTTLTWYGHSAFKLVTPSGKVIWFDPWITNPKNPTGKADLAKIDKADLILVTHGHFDHVGDAVAIGRKTHAKLVTTFDLGRAMVAELGYPKDGAGFDSQGNFGGEIKFFGGEVSVSFVPAVHSSTVSRDDPKGNSFGDLRPGGEAGGFVVAIKNGPVIYHTGDTDVFNDMSGIPKHHRITVMLACIGDHFTMGPERAAEAVKKIGPAIVVPMHYGTFPVLTGTPEAFAAALKRQGVASQMKELEVHGELKL